MNVKPGIKSRATTLFVVVVSLFLVDFAHAKPRSRSPRGRPNSYQRQSTLGTSRTVGAGLMLGQSSSSSLSLKVWTNPRFAGVLAVGFRKDGGMRLTGDVLYHFRNLMRRTGRFEVIGYVGGGADLAYISERASGSASDDSTTTTSSTADKPVRPQPALRAVGGGALALRAVPLEFCLELAATLPRKGDILLAAALGARYYF